MGYRQEHAYALWQGTCPVHSSLTSGPHSRSFLQVAIVTGGNTGIGREAVLQLARHGAKVYMASRTESRANAAIEEITKQYPDIAEKGGSIEFLKLDLCDLKGCQAAVMYPSTSRTAIQAGLAFDKQICCRSHICAASAPLVSKRPYTPYSKCVGSNGAQHLQSILYAHEIDTVCGMVHPVLILRFPCTLM